MENLEVVTDVTGTTDYAYQGDRATTLTGALSATISYDHAGRATSRTAGGPELEGFVHDTLDRLTQIRRNGAVSEILEYALTGELLFRKLGTQGTWYVGAVGTGSTTRQVGWSARWSRPWRSTASRQASSVRWQPATAFAAP